MTPDEIHEIRQIPLFAALADDVIVAVAEVGETRLVDAGAVLFRNGDPGAELLIVLSGAIRIHTSDAEHELELAVMRPGHYFGELSVIDGRPRSATATAIEPSRLFVVRRAETLKLLMRFEPLLADLLGRLAANIRDNTVHRFGLVRENEGIREEAELDRLRSLSQMVAGVAHEINTPIGIVQNAASVVTELIRPKTIPDLAKDDDAAETLNDVAEACALVQKNIAVAAKLVQSFKNLSVRQQNEALEQVDILAVVREALDLYRLKARTSHLQLVTHSDLLPSERAWTGYPGHLTQIMLNLVTNADRYAYPAERGGTIEVAIAAVKLRGEHPGFEILVRDHGVGISAENLVQIFNPFFTTGRSTGGTGLGLAIVHNLATSSLGGSIRAESELGKGTTFYLRVPATVKSEGAR